MRTKDPDSPTRTKLLDAAEELMLVKGFVATSVGEVCSAAGLTKGSFFHYFASKEALGKVLLERFAARQEAKFLDAFATIADPLDRVYRLIDCLTEGCRSPETKGCLVGTFAQEISDTHPELRAVCECSFERVADLVGEQLIAAKARHAPAAEFDATTLGQLFVALGQGSLLVLKATGDRDAMAANLRHFRNYLRTLFGR